MSTFRQILCPVDFSESSEAALRYAVGLADSLGAKLTLMHAHEIPVAFFPDLAPMSTFDWSVRLREQATARLDTMIERTCSPKKVSGIEIVEGTPHRAINETAGKVAADAIVMGTHGRNAMTRLLMGSVAERVVRTATVPVFTVRPDSPKTIRRILVATDFSDPSRRAMTLARNLRAGCGAEVEVVHVHVDPFVAFREMPRESLWATEQQFEAYLVGLESMLKKEVEKVFETDSPHVTVRVERGLAADKVLSYATDCESDLLCVGTTGKAAIERALMGSVAQRLLRTSTIPMLTVH